ncbi:hypothetical protein PSHT_00171 [Puccinia striiformis]|uniref:Abscisic acid G-protein coupled receptor-like domain-containing protein n=1 Tax=Puccinia striiformis TaxID=27350 RepID=A0A2S4WP05_9BASI|nr:hypothetical protein PSHT_00171 [Puccinia striiformis]
MRGYPWHWGRGSYQQEEARPDDSQEEPKPKHNDFLDSLHLTLISLRISYFLACRRYLQHSLLTDLTRVTESISSSTTTTEAIDTKNQQLISPNLSTLIFCWSFCEGSLLFSIVILVLGLEILIGIYRSDFSSHQLSFIVPFLECLLFSTTILSRRRMELNIQQTKGLDYYRFELGVDVTSVWSILIHILSIRSRTDKRTSSLGFLNTTLARICVPGVILIGSLSGGGAVNTAWLTWEWRRRAKEPPITDQHIVIAQKSLLRTQTDLADRKSILNQQQTHPSSISKTDGSSNLLTTLFTGSSNPKTTQLHQEIAGLEAMENQIHADLNSLKERKEYHDYSRTIPGMFLNLANWFLSVYCVYRLFMACVNLIFGYVKRPTTTTTRNPTTDIVTYLVAKILSTFNIELEISKLTRLVGLILIGSIIVVNLRSVLVWVNRVFNRFSNSNGVSSSLMLLVLAQLMAMYLLTCLISLPSSTSGGTKDTTPEGEGPMKGNDPLKSDSSLLSTLPSFSRFSKLFDLVFLSTGILTFGFRWLLNQIFIAPEPSSFTSIGMTGASNPSSSEENIALNHRIGAHFV